MPPGSYASTTTSWSKRAEPHDLEPPDEICDLAPLVTFARSGIARQCKREDVIKTFIQRLIGAATLDGRTYEEVEADGQRRARPAS